MLQQLKPEVKAEAEAEAEGEGEQNQNGREDLANRLPSPRVAGRGEG